jgi:hypothetical protein
MRVTTPDKPAVRLDLNYGASPCAASDMILRGDLPDELCTIVHAV